MTAYAEGANALKANAPQTADDSTGLRFRLSEGRPKPGGDIGDKVPPADVTPLSDADADRVLARLKPLSAQEGDTQAFSLREASLPAPRAGETIAATFPPPPSDGVPPAVESGPLTIRRVSPEGDVALADRVSVTFSQPMIPVSSQEEAARNVPVTLSPPVPGNWRWLGTQTLIFDAGSGKRLPMATTYHLTIPAGTKSENGGVLAEAKTADFATPAVRLLSEWPDPNQPQPLNPVMILRFDQAVDPDAVLKTTTVESNGKAFAIRRATDAEAAAAKEPVWHRGYGFAGSGGETPANRIVAFKPVAPLPAGTDFTVKIGPGTPSLEGPRTTAEPQSFSFQTYSALKIQNTYGDGNPPGSPWSIEFNNQLDEDAFDPTTVKIAPVLAGSQVTINGNYMTISGATKGRTTYEVTVPGTLKDTFGQTLGRSETRSFKVGPATPYIQGPSQNFIVCDPAASPRVLFQSVNTPSLRMKVYSVTPSDWSAYLKYLGRGRVDKGTPPGRLVSDKIVPLKTAEDAWGETSTDVSSMLTQGLGNLVVQWEATIRRSKDEDPDRGVFWMQATRLGVMVERDPTDLYAWVTDLATGKPVDGAQVDLPGAAADRVKTGRDGLTRLSLGTTPAQAVVVRSGGDMAFLPASQWQWQDGGWSRQTQTDSQRWFIFDDRKLYRPGETVRVKGWMRVQTAGKTSDLTLPVKFGGVDWSLRDSRGNEVKKGTAVANAWAGFDIAVDLPKTMNLGYASFQINGVQHGIQVQEFRRPEFEVSAKNESAGPHIVGDPKGADLSVTAKYYAGGALPGTSVTWNVSASPTTYAPPGHEAFTFGKWIPWWGGLGDDDEGGIQPFRRGRFPIRQPNPTQTLTGQTGGAGSHFLHLDFDGVKPARPYTISAQAVVQDVNRQTMASNASLIVHPSALYVGLKARNLFVDKGQKLSIDSIVCDIDGKLDAGHEIQFHAARKVWGYSKGRWRQNEADVHDWTSRSGAESVLSEFTPDAGGMWTIRATVHDDRKRVNESELTLWVTGGSDGPKDKQKGLTQETATLIPNQKEYRAGDTATVLVQSPFAGAEGLATIVHDGILSTQRFTMKGTTYTLHVPIADGFLPSVGVQVDLVGVAARTGDDGTPVKGAPPRPAYASGHLDLSVPPTSRRLTVTAAPDQAALAPGGKTAVSVSVKDANGKPVANAEAAVVVVDESVLALAGWNLGDPLAAFYPGRSTTVDAQHLRQYILLEDPAVITKAKDESRLRVMNRMAPVGGGGFFQADGAVSAMSAVPAPMAMAKSASMFGARAGGGGESAPPIALRTNFDALAAFAPSVKTGADGTARVPITLPDNLTRYRIVVVAVAGAKQIGSGESAITARLPLMARPSAPRFLNFGDKFELPIVLQNQTDAPMNVDVAVRGANLSFPKTHGWRVAVKANDRVEVRFPAEAVLPGTARFQVAAASGDRADAAELSLPVWTPATTEAFATYGVIDNGAIAQPVKAPADVVPQFGGLEVTTSSTALQELTDAVVYLQKYPYGCAEQIASRVLATAALRDVLTAFKTADLPKPEEMNAAMGRDLARLGEMQMDDGGFGFWTRYTKEYPYIGVHVAHALVLAKQKGFDVPKPLYDRSMAYVKAIESKYDPDYSPELRRVITAYALYVRHFAGDTDTERAKKLLAEAPLDQLGPEVVGWLVDILAGDPALAEARTWINNKATETANAAHFTFSYRDASYLVLSSNRRTDAIVLGALIADQPKSDLIPKLVRGLLDGRVRGHWSGTQEDAFILLALDRYFRTYENVTPDFTARLWLGDKSAGEGQFHGRTTDRVATNIPMAYLSAQSPAAQNLTIAKDGAGRLYYRIGMRYAPKDLSLKSADYGFSVKRTYEAIDKPTDVRHEADGAWVIRAGAKVRVRLSMVATTRRYHVALTDPMPAGFESLNSELQGTESVSRDTDGANGSTNSPYRWWSWGHWWEHENLRDERAEAFTSLLWEGAYEYVYICRATTPGQFVVPPAKAEEMYSPETFGRSGSDRVRVE